MVYTLRFFPSKCSLFHNSNLFGSCIIHILYTGCAKIKKKKSGAKRLMYPTQQEVACGSLAGKIKINVIYGIWSCQIQK